MRIPKGQSRMANPEKLGTQGTQDKDKQNKNTTHYVLDTTIWKQAQITMQIITLENTEGASKYGQSREIGNKMKTRGSVG